MENDLLYQMALSGVPGIGPVSAKKLIGHFGTAQAIFRARKPELAKICKGRADNILRFNGFQEIENELRFLEKYSMRPLFITDKDYPQRLLSCSEAPILLFFKGTADLNAPKILSVIGTRSPSEYGKQIVKKFISELTSYGSGPLGPGSSSSGPLIVSGLAYGIDGLAHEVALDHNLPTVGVLAHGLDRIYPRQHTGLAKKMVKEGGLLTQFRIGTDPNTHNFPTRNKIVAGICDALLVVETATGGGSMLTVGNALKYNKKIFTFPGRINDPKSSGCNALIRNGTARLLTDAQQLIDEMKWEQPAAGSAWEKTSLLPPITKEANLFLPIAREANMSEAEKELLRLFQGQDILSLDQLSSASSQQSSALAMALLNLELEGWIDSLPGKRYRRHQ